MIDVVKQDNYWIAYYFMQTSWGEAEDVIRSLEWISSIFEAKGRLQVISYVISLSSMKAKAQKEKVTMHGLVQKEYDKLIKVLVIGDAGVGKTALITRFVDHIFQENYVSTIGIDFKCKICTIKNTRVKMQLWDTAGQQRFHTITAGYYRGAHAIIVMFDITSNESFHSLQYWLRHIEENSERTLQKVIVGSKGDLYLNKQVNVEQIAALCEELNVRYIEISSRTGRNVEQLFEMVGQLVLDKNYDKQKSGLHLSTRKNITGLQRGKKKCQC